MVKRFLKLGGNLERVAEARVAIDQARLLTLYAAYKMDTLGNMAALTEISAIKVVAPSVLEKLWIWRFRSTVVRVFLVIHR